MIKRGNECDWANDDSEDYVATGLYGTWQSSHNSQA